MSDLKINWWLLRYIRPYFKSFLMILLFSLCISYGAITVPLFVNRLIDDIIPNHDTTLFVQYSTLLVVAVTAIITMDVLKSKWIYQIVEYPAYHIQMDMMNKLQRLGIPYAEQHTVGDSLSLFQTEIEAVKTMYRTYIPDLIEYSIFVISLLTFLCIWNLQITLIIIGGWLLYYTFGPYLDKKSEHYAALYAKEQVTLNNDVYNFISANAELRAYGVTGWGEVQLMKRQKQTLQSYFGQIIFAYARGTFRKLTTDFGAIATIMIGIHFFVLNDRMSVGQFITYLLLYYIMLFNGTVLITMIAEQKVYLSQVKRIYEFLLKPINESQEPNIIVENFKGINLQDVSYQSGERKLLQNINLHISPGEKVAVIGTSGSGKSTLLKIISGLYEPSDGSVLISGLPIQQIDPEHLRSILGIVFQETYLYGGSVASNILFGNPGATEPKWLEAAEAAQVHSFVASMPQQYQTMVGERGNQLSGGQRQRISLARMFLKQPDVMLIDEGTAALDYQTEQHIMEWLRQTQHTVFFVTHRLDSIPYFKRVLVMEQGQLIHDLPVADLEASGIQLEFYLHRREK